MFGLLKNLMYPVYYYILGTFGIIEDLFYRHYNKCVLQSRSGDVAVITGGARGIGAEVVKKLLQCEMHVVIGCRNVSAGTEMVKGLRSQGLCTGSTSILPLDMASLDSIKAFATAVLNTRPKVHLLINNAGIMFPPYSETADGYESQWAVNYLGHFLLCHLLLPRLHDTGAADGAARIVNVSSCAHHAAYNIDFHNINMKNDFITQAAYAQSKIAQIMFTFYLNRELQQVGSNVQVVAVHPGIVNTDIFNGTLMKNLMPWAPRLLFKTADEGATTVMFAALHAKGGEYISNGRPADVLASAREKQVQTDLFNYSKRTLGLSSFGGLQL